ncbi:MAG: T9SS type A sorting domain-containing protein [Bacteroidetes bacterium]|nr:T9SS type A sorting domain-containing protein [Bacteroidota bacterium]
MNKIFWVALMCLLFEGALAQKVNINPTITPTLFKYNDQITVSYDVTGTALAALSDAWVWVWIPNTTINAKYNINPATSAALPAHCTKSTPSGKVIFSITFRPSDFFSSDISTQTQMGILLKAMDWPNGQTTDYLVNFWDGTFQAKLISPTVQPLFVVNGSVIQVQAATPVAADYSFYIGNVLVDTKTNLTSYSYSLTVNDSIPFYTATLKAIANSTTSTVAFTYNIHKSSPVLARPVGIIDGINYNLSDPTKATLCFWAPGKSSVYAFGDFTDWNILPKYLMNKDGEHFWVEVSGLTSGTEYAFQYLVNDSLRIADPYSDKILEPDDNKIPATTYPNLKTIPSKALSSQWYFNHFSVLQTAQAPYQWQTPNYQKPAKEKLVIYELLIRDFFSSDHRNFQSLIDTVSYFKRLGINAVELMPVTEFNGEIGWGYNPTSMFALQKYYGTKNKMKEFVDKCHANGIAVIMDMVMNHQDLPNSYALLDFDFANGHPKSANKWFNVSAPHPYSVFFDLNHESKYTQKYLDTVNYYWMNEFKIDGYRYDLSKGFTQTKSTESTAGNYDQSRINNLTRMADALWARFPDAYIILEHFAANAEETVLANYRVGEGKGMMLWGNFNYAYSQATMGYSSGSDIGWMYYGNRGWTSPRAVGYMESHDEERIMYRNLQYGNVSGSYSVKNLATALQRMKTAAVMFYTIPGPKMLWEFGEFGFDLSINTCLSKSVNDTCRLTPKPALWTNYLQDQDRTSLQKHISDLIRLRKNYDVFTTKGAATITSGSSLVQQMTLKNTPYTSVPNDSTKMNVQIAANFDVTGQVVSILFPHTGTWYDYYNQGAPVTVSGAALAITLQPGDFKLYTDVKIKSSIVTTIKDELPTEVSTYPNPTQGQLYIESDNRVENIYVRTITGSVLNPNRIDENTWDVSFLSPGLYIIEIKTGSGITRKKIIKN